MGRKISGEAVFITLGRNSSGPPKPSLAYLMNSEGMPPPFSDEKGNTIVFSYKIVGVRETSEGVFLEIFCYANEESLEEIFEGDRMEKSPGFYLLEVDRSLVSVIMGMSIVDDSFYVCLVDEKHRSFVVENKTLDESIIPVGVLEIPRLNPFELGEEASVSISQENHFLVLARERLNNSLREISPSAYYSEESGYHDEHVFREIQSAVFEIILNLKEGSILEGWVRLTTFISFYLNGGVRSEGDLKTLEEVFRLIYLQSSPNVRFHSEQEHFSMSDSDSIFSYEFEEIVRANNLDEVPDTLSAEEYLKQAEGDIPGDNLNLSYPLRGEIPENIKIILGAIKEVEPEILELVDYDYINDRAWDYAMEKYGTKNLLRIVALIVAARLILLSSRTPEGATSSLIKIMSADGDPHPWELVPIGRMLAKRDDKPLMELFEINSGEGTISGYLVILLNFIYYKVDEEGWNSSNLQERLAEYEKLSNEKVTPDVSRMLGSIVDVLTEEDGGEEFVRGTLEEDEYDNVNQTVGRLLFTLGDYSARKGSEGRDLPPDELSLYREYYLEELFRDVSTGFERTLF